MDTAPGDPPDPRLVQALRADESSTRLKAALAAGTHPHPDLLEALVARCAVEPDFFVRDMLTWALTRLPAALTVPRLRAELDREPAQARSQALHTLSKIRDGSAYPAITRALLRDPDDEVARAAWRAAVTLVPDGERERLAVELASQLGRGGRAVQLSLSRALVDLGEVIEPVLRGRLDAGDPTVRAHARATELLLGDPEVGFDAAVAEATRIVALGPGRGGAQAC
ncbi:HEAT repeat domain-containing protein [Micromonospora sp. SH-82]|uniref:HEAT repeat domain-containing protein n=1 Tax=Micromonospora sp. SH-82 TaxID=3132938 RepID=UPI003EBB6391